MTDNTLPLYSTDWCIVITILIAIILLSVICDKFIYLGKYLKIKREFNRIRKGSDVIGCVAKFKDTKYIHEIYFSNNSVFSCDDALAILRLSKKYHFSIIVS